MASPVPTLSPAQPVPAPTVVCVDDDPEILDSLHSLLALRGYEVLTTSLPDEALRWFETGAVDVVVLDHDMPTVTGVELARRLRAENGRVPLVMFSGTAPADHEREAVDWYVPKGIGCRHLLDTIATALAAEHARCCGAADETNW